MRRHAADRASHGLALRASLFALMCSPLDVSSAPGTTVETAANDSFSTALEEVVVSVRKRQENELDVPISVSTVSGATLQRDGDYGIQDLAEKVPNLQIEPSNPRQTSISIRGLGKNSANDGLETSVGVYVDGVYLSQPGMATIDLTDIEQVDVLRGPQGTLFGKNNTGGVVSISTAKPSFTPAAQAELIGGNYGTYEVHASATGGLSDTVAVRLSAYDRHRDGVLDNLYDGDKFNGSNRQGVRAQLLFDPTTDLTFRLIAEHYQSSERTGGVVNWLSNPQYSNGLPINKTIGALTAPFGYTPEFNPWSRHIDLNSAQPATTNQDAVSLQSTWKLGDYALDSITAFRHYTFSGKNDGDVTPIDAVNYSGTNSKNKQYSEELRIASPATAHFDYIAGIYVYHDNLWSNSDQLNGSQYAAFNGIALADAAALDGVVQNTVGNPIVDSLAAFAQANFHFLERWTVTTGLRETNEHKSATIQNFVTGGADPATLSAADLDARAANTDATRAYASFTDRALSWLGSVSCRINDNVNAYVTASKGFKSGGINIEVTNVPLVVAPETALDFEAGIKSQWLSNRLQLNTNVYDTTIKNYQGNFLSTLASLGTYLANVGTVKVRGVEFEAQALPLEGLRLSAGTAYNRATYANFYNGACPLEVPPPQKICNFTGQQLPFAPLWSSTANAAYSYDLGSGLTAYTVGNVFARSAQNVNTSLSDYGKQKGYTITNFQVGATRQLGRGNYDISLWVKNLADIRYLTSLATIPGSKSLDAGLGDPRTFGATVRVNF